MSMEEAIQRALVGAGSVEKLFGHRELKELPKLLQPGELPERIIQGRFSGGQGVLVATDRRLLFVDKGIFGSKVVDFPYDRISSIEYSTGLLMGEIRVTVSANVSKIDQVHKQHIQGFVALVRSKIEAAHGQPPPVAASDPVAQLERLAKLREAGHISDAEFQAQKARLFGM